MVEVEVEEVVRCLWQRQWWWWQQGDMKASKSWGIR
jgi:hypothetical protein